MQFSFPPLKNKEILACLKELNIPLTLDELKNPDAKRMREVYEVFVEVLMGVSKDDLRQPQFGAMDAFKYPELHEESISEISMCKTMYVRTGFGGWTCRW